MPRYASSKGLPIHVQPIVNALGANQVRIAIILDLLEHPHSTRTDISQRTGIGAPTVYVHLQSLETLGVVYADVDPDQRQGHTVHYDANRPQLLADLDALAKQITDTHLG